MAPPKDLKQKCLEFILLEGYFNPETFSELEYSLHNQEYPSKALIRELCKYIRCSDICEKCQATCNWKEFCKKINKLYIERSPPCIQKAYKLGKYRLVKSYFNLLGLFSDEKKDIFMKKCGFMKKQRLCEPDKFCKSIESGNLTEYYDIRLREKITDKL